MLLDKLVQNHRQFQKAVRRFVDEVIYPDAQVLASDEYVFDPFSTLLSRSMMRMVSGQVNLFSTRWRTCISVWPPAGDVHFT